MSILDSGYARKAVRRLEGRNAQIFLDAVQDVLDRGSLPTAKSCSKARKLMRQLAEKREQLPSSLFISGVSDHDEHPTFRGGFGDIYRASYAGRLVALKRI
ncbi:hypothetical protein FB451DRAFT_1046147 [Mycena latifolia]|nr:hypothetical protein FB451DRAFT_1046147 [Mycena latifolia]